MARSRRRERSRGDGNSPRLVLAILAIAVVAGAATAFVPTGAFTTAAMDRPGQMDVAIDEAGALEMAITDCMDDKGWNDMVTVTNRLNVAADVTVALDDPDIGSIKGGSGGSRTVTLAQAASETFEFKYGGNGPYPDQVDFDVSAFGTGLTADASRSSAVSDDGTCDGGDGGGGDGGDDGTNEPPIADFTYERQNPNFVDLNGTPSSDPDGSITKWEWDVGNDGTIDHTGETVTKVRAGSGTEVRLIVTDNDGATGSVTKTV